MIEKCADYIVTWLQKSEIIKETDRELYWYAVYSLFLSLLPILLATGFGLLMGCMKESLSIIIPFMIIRKFSGGYHTKKMQSCFLISSILIWLCISLSLWVKFNWQFVIVIAIASVSLSILSPIENINRSLNQKEKRQYKKTTIILLVIFLSVIGSCLFTGLENYAIGISIGITLTATLQYPCIIQNKISLQEKDREH